MKNKFKKQLRKGRSGFTLVETLFAMSIFVMLMVATTYFARNIWIYNSFIGIELNDLDTGRAVLKTMVSQIRTASSANTGAYAVNQATSTSFIFYADINNDGLKERIRYFLNGSLVQKGVTVPSGSPLAYNLANEQITTLIRNVTSTSIFSYYDGNYDGTTAALAAPVDVGAVRMVGISVTVDQNPGQSPNATTFSTLVMIRNLKDNL